MDIAAIIIVMILACILVLTFYIIGVFNDLLDAKKRVEDQFKPIDIELNKIKEITEKLIETVAKHTKHETKIISEVEKAKDKLGHARTINGKISAVKSLNKSLEKLFNLKETYSEIKKSKNISSLEKELNEIKEKLNYASVFYNDTVTKYNTIRTKPAVNIIAKIFKFKEIEYLKIDKE